MTHDCKDKGPSQAARSILSVAHSIDTGRTLIWLNDPSSASAAASLDRCGRLQLIHSLMTNPAAPITADELVKGLDPALVEQADAWWRLTVLVQSRGFRGRLTPEYIADLLDDLDDLRRRAANDARRRSGDARRGRAPGGDGHRAGLG